MGILHHGLEPFWGETIHPCRFATFNSRKRLVELTPRDGLVQARDFWQLLPFLLPMGRVPAVAGGITGQARIVRSPSRCNALLLHPVQAPDGTAGRKYNKTSR